MTKYENHCCGCATPGYPCMGSSCPNRNVAVFYCDKCDPECENPLDIDEVYESEGDDLCESCLHERHRKEI